MNPTKFWARVAPPNDNGCRLWKPGGKHRRYGQIKVNGQRRQAHQVAWELANGRPWPPGAKGLHSCDVTLCCEPTHMSPGTDAANAADRNVKQRQARGDRHGRTKLTTDDLNEIRRLLSEGIAQRAVASRFGVSQITVSRVARDMQR